MYGMWQVGTRKEHQKIGQGKGTKIAFEDCTGLICGMPTKMVGPHWAK